MIGTFEGAALARALAPAPQPWPRIPDTMTTRTAALLTIGLLAVLLAVVALAALYAGDVSERAGAIVTTVLGSFATVLAGLLLFLRVETVNTKVDDVAEKAAVAAEKADDVGRKVDRVHDDVLNGPLRQNVKRAIAEAETDPHIVERRIETTARGVQQDRHETASREQAAYARGVTDTIRRFRPDGGELPPEQAQ
jgi:hypothetical protein